jgi:hypothetical protein
MGLLDCRRSSICSISCGGADQIMQYHVRTWEDALTGHIEIENVIFLHRVIDQFPTRFIHHQDFPLNSQSQFRHRSGGESGGCLGRTSSPPVARIVFRMTVVVDD